MKAIRWRPIRSLLAANLPGLCTGAALYLTVLAAHGQTYYVSSSGGNDSNNGTSTGTPWQTLDKANQNIANGVTIRLKAGDEFRGSLNVAGVSNVTVNSYDTGDRPVVKQSVPISNGSWAAVKGMPNVYRAALSLGNDHRVRYVYANGERMTLARHPDTGWLRNDPTSPGSVLADSDLTESAGHWAGAEVVLRTSNWGYEKYEVTASAVGSLTLDGTPPEWVQIGDWGYFLQGKLNMMNAAGEWYHDHAGGWLYFRALDNNSPTDVEVSVEALLGGADWTNQGVNNNQAENITINGIAFQHQPKAGVSVYDCDNVSVLDCDFSEAYMGISSNVGTGATYEGNHFQHLYDAGIRTSIHDLLIADNTLQDIALWPGLGQDNWGYFGILSYGDEVKVQDNYLDNIGYNAIGVGGSNGRVQHNSVTRSPSILNDGSGITFDNCDGLVVSDNVVADLKENLTQRLESVSENYWERWDISFGIYFGNLPITNTTVERNVVSRCGAGIHVDHTVERTGVVVRDNTLFNNNVQLSLSDYSNCMSGSGPPDPCQGTTLGEGGDFFIPAYDTRYEGNILYSMDRTQRCMQQAHAYSPDGNSLVDYGVFTGNHFYNPFDQVTIYQRVWYEVDAVTDYLAYTEIPWTLTGWEKATGNTGSFQSPLRLKDYLLDDPSLAYMSALSDDMDAGETGWGWTISGVDPTCLHSELDLGGGDKALRTVDCNWIERSCPTCAEIVGSGAAPGLYRFNFLIRSPDTDAILVAAAYNDIDDVYMDHVPVPITPNWEPREVLVNVSAGSTGMYFFTAFQNVQYSLGVLGTSTVELNNLEVHRCTLDPTYPGTVITDEHILRYHCPLDGTESEPGNTVATGGEFTVPGTTGQCWSDVYGNFYAAGDEIELDEWASIVLFRMNVDAANLALDGNDEHHITSDQVWTTNMNVEGSVVVKDGATLTIDGAHIGFAPTTGLLTTNLIVEPGGHLIVRNGATLRNWMGCDAPADLWDGVEVYAQQTFFPTVIKVGRVDLTTGATVINAKVAVMSGSGDPANPASGLPTNWAGGHIVATNASFINNQYDVVAKGGVTSFYPVHVDNGPTGGLQYEPSLTRCTFKTTGPLLGAVPPKARVRYYGQWQPGIRGCNFANMRGGHTSSSTMGHAIDLFYSGARIQKTVGANPVPNTFANFGHAVRLLDASYHTKKYMVVEGNTFTDNICGAFVSGAVGSYIVNNTFEMGRWNVTLDNPEEENWEENHRAIFTTSSYAFQIRGNTVAPSAQAHPSVEMEGIVVGFTRDHNDVVWKNTASGMERAFVGEGVSADINGTPNTIGLQFHCNTNDGNATNLMSRMANGASDPLDHTIRGFQGDNTLAAGNELDQNSGGWDFQMTTEYVQMIKYYFDDGEANQEPIYFTVITGVSEVDPVPLTSEDNACDVNPYEGSGGSSFMMIGLLESRQAYDELHEQYVALIDGGDTEALVAQITGTWHQEVADLRTQLLTISPFVSTEALKVLMDQPAVPDSVRLEVCAANPDATSVGGFLTWAEAEAFQPMDVADMAAIASTWNTTTARTTMEQQLAQRHSALTRAVHHRLHDTTAAPASLRWVWQQLRTNAARYAEASLLLEAGDHAEALAVIQAMTQERRMSTREEAERSRMLTYISVLQGAAEDDRNAYHLIPAEVETLQEMVGTHYDRPSVWASNLLCVAYGHCRAPYTGGSGGDPKQLVLPQEEPAPLPISSALRLYPNPTSSHIMMSYLLPGHSGVVTLTVRDAQGRVLDQLNEAGEQGQRTWDTRRLAPGIYTVELRREGRVEHTERLVIQP